MRSLPTRLFCVLLSAVGAAGLVSFADPANAVGIGPHRHCVIVAAAAAPATGTQHG